MASAKIKSSSRIRNAVDEKQAKLLCDFLFRHILITIL